MLTIPSYNRSGKIFLFVRSSVADVKAATGFLAVCFCSETLAFTVYGRMAEYCETTELNKQAAELRRGDLCMVTG